MTRIAPTALLWIEGYLPIADHGLVGDGATAALIGRDGAVAWLCLPRCDSPPLFCNLLDRERVGIFRIMQDDLRESRHIRWRIRTRSYDSRVSMK